MGSISVVKRSYQGPNEQHAMYRPISIRTLFFKNMKYTHILTTLYSFTSCLLGHFLPLLPYTTYTITLNQTVFSEDS